MLAVGAVTFAAVTGFYQGAEWQKGKQAKQEVKVLTQKVEVVKQVQVGQDKIAAAYEKGRTEREEEFRKLQLEFDQKLQGVLAALPTACTWSDDVVSLLNRARGAGRPAANPSSAPVPLPTPRSTYRWETGISSPADGAGREAVPRL